LKTRQEEDLAEEEEEDRKSFLEKNDASGKESARIQHVHAQSNVSRVRFPRARFAPLVNGKNPKLSQSNI